MIGGRIKLTIAMLMLFGCNDDEPIDCLSTALSVSVSNIMDTSCGLANGSFDISVTGGSEPYEYSLTNTDFQPVPSNNTSIAAVAAGNYQLTIRDANQCMASTAFRIFNENQLSVTTTMVPSGCGTADGTIALTVTGGQEPYWFSLNGGATQTENTFSGLAAGEYSVHINDQGSCETNLSLDLTSGISFKEDIFPIIELNCAIADCHDGSDVALPDWTVFTTVQSLAGTIKLRTSNETMPPPGSPDLTPSQIQAIACWVDDGATNN